MACNFFLLARGHVVQARGSELQNDKYCKKDGVIAVEMGTMNASIGEKGCKAQSSDTLHKIIQQRIDGVTPVQIAAGPDIVLYFRYQKQIEKAVADYIQAENVAELVNTFWGPACLLRLLDVSYFDGVCLPNFMLLN